MEEYCDVAIKTSQLCINWLKPDGGDAIDEYFVEWLRADGSTYSTRLDHIRGQSVYNYTITGLLPRENITSFVIASNDAGNGTSLQESHITSALVKNYSVNYSLKPLSIKKVSEFFDAQVCSIYRSRPIKFETVKFWGRKSNLDKLALYIRNNTTLTQLLKNLNEYVYKNNNNISAVHKQANYDKTLLLFT